MIRLGVNIDHVATLRQVRGGTTSYPNLVEIADQVVEAGADQITIHLREDRRHIQLQDVKDLIQWRRCPINLEMAVTEEMEEICLSLKPDWICLVPEKREELTTEGGLNVVAAADRISRFVEKAKKEGVKTSLFVDSEPTQIRASAEVGGDAIELHTGHWVLQKDRSQDWEKLKASAELAKEIGLKVHAGHGLCYETTKEICALPHLEELNIGHSIVCYAISDGISQVVKNMKEILS